MGYRINEDSVTLECDTPGCDSALTEPKKGSQLDTIRAVRKKAKGWTNTSEKHFCRRCSNG